MRRKRRALLQTPVLLPLQQPQPPHKAKVERDEVHFMGSTFSLFTLVRIDEDKREREREKCPLFFFGKQIGKIFGKFLFSSLNSTNFAIFLENSPNFRYEKIEKKNLFITGFFFLAKVSQLEICFSKWLKVFTEGFYSIVPKF
jgi:hypothetical protein